MIPNGHSGDAASVGIHNLMSLTDTIKPVEAYLRQQKWAKPRRQRRAREDAEGEAWLRRQLDGLGKDPA